MNTLADVQKALVSWVATASGFASSQVIWDGQQIPAREGAFIKLRFGDILALGSRDEEQQINVPTWLTGSVYEQLQQVIDGSGELWQCTTVGPAASTVSPSAGGADGYIWSDLGSATGKEIEILDLGRREFSLSVQCFGTAGQEAGTSSPTMVLSNVRAALAQPTPRALLDAVGVSCFDRGPVRNVAALAGTIFEPRAIFESRWYSNEVVWENTGYIKTVNVAGQIIAPGDPLSPIAVDATITLPNG